MYYKALDYRRIKSADSLWRNVRRFEGQLRHRHDVIIFFHRLPGLKTDNYSFTSSIGVKNKLENKATTVNKKGNILY